MYYFDNYGWYSPTEIPGRSTSVPPPMEIPEGQAANWTGYTWVLMNYVEPTPPPSPIEQQWALIRYQRDQLLKDTDWTQLADASDDIKIKYQSYRQALRDIPQTQTDPYNIIWPTLAN